ncbi:MAG: DNA polymerase IV [Treponema sp.]|nr:DNA polymerase IV [Treponema sp.]
MQRWYLHADLDAFFASVEQLDHPEYRGKPLIVGGLPEDPRSVVSTASYEARKYGVHSAMPTKEAYRLCPNGIYIHGNYHRYEEVSWQIMQIFKRWSPDVQQMSIDEAFIDLTGTERLFGPPEETAMKIKKEVFEETGLTISIGLACTKYFAKLSSEINKPDGFYFMKPGTETDYMLSIPIEKIWGIGKKTAARIKDSGIKTTRQIYETDLPTLTFLYGENTASFLYNILRGKADDMFNTEAKTHSISNERTFPFDITDSYACETALMELAHTVMFRLLREELHSRTVVIKIRYDDFSTVSARQTYETDIITLDSFFEKVRDLFNRKYERTRGVRLLGVGFDNVHKEESTYQQNLFDDGQKKKQAVEKAILKLETKYPDLHVQKARVIKPKTKSILTFLLLGALSFIAPSRLSALESSILDEPEILPIPGEAPPVLFDISKNDSRIEIFSSGYWKAEVTESTIFNFGNSNPFGISLGLPIFKQDVNLDFRIIYKQKWFFETIFAEQFKKNTIAFGFENGKTIQKALLSNRNIVYPADYSSNLFGFNPQGGNNQAPGFSMNMAGENWNADFLIRYDITQKKEAVFYGSNQVSDINLSPKNYISGRFFTLPSGYIKDIEAVYIENKEGDIKSNDGRRFKKLSSSQYMLRISENLIIISRDVSHKTVASEKPYILVTFNNEKKVSELISEAGSFSLPESYFGKIQAVFSTDGALNLENYWTRSEYILENKKMLILQTGKKFSPFEDASYYDGGLISESDFLIQSKTTEVEFENYKITKADISSLFSGSDYFNEQHQYFNISSEEERDKIQNRYPLAEEDPYIYLSDDSKTDVSILLRTYSPVSFFQIPQTASKGSVKVTVNGITDSNASFDSDTGLVSLSTSFKESDRIIISWDEEGTDFKSGSLTTAAGIRTNFTPFFSGDLDITSSWPLFSSEKTSASDQSTQGYVSLNGGIAYKKNIFSFSNNSSAAFINDNVNGKYIIHTTTGSIPETHYLQGSSGISVNGNVPVSGIKDKEISGYAIPLEYDFYNDVESSKSNGIEIHTVKPESSHSFTIALKPVFENGKNVSEGTELILQLGVHGKNDEIKPDDYSIPAWDITKQIDFNQNKWQEVSVTLSEKDQVHLSEFNCLRLTVNKKENFTAESVYGILLAGPYEFEAQNLLVETSRGINAKSTAIEKENKTENRIIWETLYPQDYPSISFTDYFQAADFSQYDSVNVDLYIKKLSSYIENPDECTAFVCTFYRNSQPAFEFHLSPEIIQNLAENPEKCHTLSMNFSEKCIYIDSTKLKESDYLISEIISVVPNKFEITFKGFESGIIETGDIYYSGNCSSFALQNYFSSSVEKGPHLVQFQSKIKETPGAINPFYTEASALGKTAFLNLNLSGDAKINNSESPLESAGHSVSFDSPVLKILHIDENYRFTPGTQSADKNRIASINFSPVKIPVLFSYDSKQKENISGYSGTAEYLASTETKYFSGKFSYSTKEQKRKAEIKDFERLIKNQKYFSVYGLFEENFFSFGNENAILRNQDYKTKFSGNVNLLELKPEIEFTLSDSYFTNSNFWFTDKETFALIIPLSIKENSFSFSWKKETENTEETTYGGNYKTDTQKLFNLQKERLYFYKTILFADLFEPLKENYTTDYGIYWTRPISNSIKDLLIPTSLSVNTGRIIIKEDLIHDYYQTKLSSSYQAFNLFGKESLRKYFSWYSTDELSSSFEITVKTPSGEPENTLYSISSYLQILFYIKSGNSLKTAFDYYIQTNSDWSSRQTAVYTSPGNKSPLNDLIRLFNKEKLKGNKISRKEIFNSEFGNTDSTPFQNYAFSHLCEINFLSYYSIFAEAETSFSHKKNKGDTLGISLTLGGKITY